MDIQEVEDREEVEDQNEVNCVGGPQLCHLEEEKDDNRTCVSTAIFT